MFPHVSCFQFPIFPSKPYFLIPSTPIKPPFFHGSNTLFHPNPHRGTVIRWEGQVLGLDGTRQGEDLQPTRCGDLVDGLATMGWSKNGEHGCVYIYIHIWVNDHISLTWIKAILGWLCTWYIYICTYNIYIYMYVYIMIYLSNIV